MKNFSIVLIILMLITFTIYIYYSKTTVKVLRVYNPSSIAIDINRNGRVDVNEKFTVNGVETLTSLQSDYQRDLAKSLGIDEEIALGIGYYAEKYAQSILLDKNVKYKILPDGTINISFEAKNYNKIMQMSAFAIKDKKAINKKKFNEQASLVKKVKLRIYNNKSNKYHHIDCKYGQMAHDSVILPINSIPKDAKPCKYCSDKSYKNKIAKSIKQKPTNAYEVKVISEAKPQKFTISNGKIKLILTDFTTHFTVDTKCTSEYCTELLKNINNSKHSIDMALYGYADIPDVTNAIRNAIQRGVNVRMVYDVDKDNGNYYNDTFKIAKMISESKNDSIYKKSKYMHNKFWIFDENVVITGSANACGTDFSEFNANSILIIQSPEVAQIYKKEFEQMYDEKFHDKKEIIENKENILLGESIASIYFSPIDNIITDKLIPFIENAHHYVYMPIFVLTHKKLTSALIDAKKRGVDVKIILDATGAGNTYSTHEELRKNGIPIKVENYAGKMHSKSIIIDDEFLVAGSMNFSKNGESANDENCIVIENPYLTKYYKTFFNYIWNKIPDIWLTKNPPAESHYSIGSCYDGIDNNFDGKIDNEDVGCIQK